jgi:hypothetical protein
MDRNEMTVCIVGLTLLCAFLMTPAACTMHRQRMVVEAIKAGADPTAAKCAIEADQGSVPACILSAVGRPK